MGKDQTPSTKNSAIPPGIGLGAHIALIEQRNKAAKEVKKLSPDNSFLQPREPSMRYDSLELIDGESYGDLAAETGMQFGAINVTRLSPAPSIMHFRIEKKLSTTSPTGRKSTVNGALTKEDLAAVAAEREAAAKRDRLAWLERRSLPQTVFRSNGSKPAPGAKRYDQKSDWIFPVVGGDSPTDMTRRRSWNSVRFVRPDGSPFGDDDITDDDDLQEPEQDDYTRLAASVPEPSDVEEDTARELTYGLTPGTIEQDRLDQEEFNDAVRHQTAARQRERRETEALLWQFRNDIKEGRAEDDGRFSPNTALCQNPNKPGHARAKPGGTRCSGCFEYCRTHHGNERSADLINKNQSRKAL